MSYFGTPLGRAGESQYFIKKVANGNLCLTEIRKGRPAQSTYIPDEPGVTRLGEVEPWPDED